MDATLKAFEAGDYGYLSNANSPAFSALELRRISRLVGIALDRR
jgi:hypothetical protein